MDTIRLYYVASGICGAALLALAISSLLGNGFALIPTLLAIGGGGLILGIAYEAFFAGERRYDPGRRLVLLTVACGVLVLVSAGLFVATEL